LRSKHHWIHKRDNKRSDSRTFPSPLFLACSGSPMRCRPCVRSSSPPLSVSKASPHLLYSPPTQRRHSAPRPCRHHSPRGSQSSACSDWWQLQKKLQWECVQHAKPHRAKPEAACRRDAPPTAHELPRPHRSHSSPSECAALALPPLLPIPLLPCSGSDPPEATTTGRAMPQIGCRARV
jgi:hypothetical protein